MKMKTLSPQIDGPRIELRKHEEALAAQMFAYVDKDRKRLQHFLPWVPFVKSFQDELGYIQRTHKQWDAGELFDYGIFRKSDNMYIGNIGVHTIEWEHNRCEIGYWILGDFEGQGFVSEALRILEKHLFKMGFNRIEVHCSSLNSRSAQVPHACAYVFDSVLKEQCIENDEYRDTFVFSKLAKQYKNDFIRKTTYLDKNLVLNIAQKLPEHFTSTGLKILESDFDHQKGLLFFSDDKAVGFLLYFSHQSEIEIAWMGVLPSHQNQKIGRRLLHHLESLAQVTKSKNLVVRTLDESVEYSPYEKTRSFYLKMGFQKFQVIEHADNPEWSAELIFKKTVSN